MTRILGIDFSGAKNAGKKIWIATAHQSRGPLQIQDCRPASTLPASGRSPEIALAALRRYITEVPDTIAGCDFPFSLSLEMIYDDQWSSFSRNFTKRYPSPIEFYNSTHAATGGLEWKRRTDYQDRTPFNAFNLRLYRQTWWGIGHLLAPLIADEAVTVWPQMKRRLGAPVLIEVCAACSLISLLHYPSYKGKTKTHAAARAGIVDMLTANGWLAPLETSMQASLIENTEGDALDAVIGAVAVNRADLTRKPDRIDRFEGRVFYEL